ncbi:hypothetical protein [uncultured Psychrobacter sp.]|uniref:hypothetical protein n=1 Tax=uncultured Psychrobacter sp. TaxID=259303 RepID=UPI002623606F|nr:hypothetical protein [uncultured Psychrobacter sp.]
MKKHTITHGISQKIARNKMPDDSDQIVLLTNDQLIEQVDLLSVEYPYNYNKNWIAALKEIVTSINLTIQQRSPPLIEQLIAIKNGLFFQEDVSKKTLNALPPILQPLFLLDNLTDNEHKKIIWLCISIHTYLLLSHHKKAKTHLTNVINRFKLPVFSNSKNNRWIWEVLPKLDDLEELSNTVDFIYVFFVGQLGIIAYEQEVRIELLINTEESEATVRFRSKKFKQLNAIVKCFEQAYYPNKKITRQRKKKDKYLDPFESEATEQLADFVDGSTWVENSYWNQNKYDIESDAPHLYYQYPAIPDFDYELYSPNSRKPKNIEEYMDTLERPLIVSLDLPDKKVRYMQPLHRIEKNVHHSYISQRELELNSNVRTLSVAGLKQVFGRLAIDSHQHDYKHNKASLILLLSMITAVPVELLMTTGFIPDSGLFTVLGDAAYLQYQLQITDRKHEYDANIHENQKRIISLPMPMKLIKFLSHEKNLPNKDDILDYIRTIKEDIDLPYLSVVRIETALHIVLHRYIRGGNQHIADLICRIPASLAPSTYYSSHNNEFLIKRYRQAIELLNYDNQLDDSFIGKQSTRIDFTTGSGFALTLKYVNIFLQDLSVWVDNGDNREEHFNRYSALVWIQFCLLTGTRPNNGLTNVRDIDLEVGWYEVADKPNKVVKNHRLIPLCPTLLAILKKYQLFLVDYQPYATAKVDKMIHQIKQEQDELTLLNMLSDSYDKLIQIKRSHISKLLVDYMPFDDSYWTRHFLRTQLEKLGVSMILINTVIGHEKNRQEALGQFSSINKQQIWQVRDTFEEIAQQMNLKM